MSYSSLKDLKHEFEHIVKQIERLFEILQICFLTNVNSKKCVDEKTQMLLMNIQIDADS